VIRLLNEGIELMRSGTITLPRPEKKLLITIRTGNYGSLDRVLKLANSLFLEPEGAETKSSLPEKVDRSQVSQLVSEAYLRFWNSHHPHRDDSDKDAFPASRPAQIASGSPVPVLFGR